MELYHKILAEYYAELECPGANIDGTQVILDRCYQALCQVRCVLADDTLEDADCFSRIENIVNVLEELGLDAGSRHDFG